MSDDDPDTNRSEVTQRHYDPGGRRELTTTIVFAVAEAEGVPPSELRSPPLYDAVDVPAIENAFFGANGDRGSRKGVGSIEFRYTGYLVTVRNDGWVQVSRPTGATGP